MPAGAVHPVTLPLLTMCVVTISLLGPVVVQHPVSVAWVVPLGVS